MPKSPSLAARLKLARRVQQALEPPATFRLGPLEVATSLQICAELGGDLLCFRTAPRWIGILLGDVMGKGVEAALAAAYLEGLYDELARACGPREILEIVNHRFWQRFRGELFATLLCGQLDLGTGRWVVARAGHPPALLLRADGGLSLLDPAGIPIGIEDGESYEQLAVPALPGDDLLLASDGVWDGDLPETAASCARRWRGCTVPQSLEGWMTSLPQPIPLSDDRTAAWLRLDRANLFGENGTDPRPSSR